MTPFAYCSIQIAHFSAGTDVGYVTKHSPQLDYKINYITELNGIHLSCAWPGPACSGPPSG